MENPYDILGVSRDASLDEVKKAYRKKARENHPDLNPGDKQAEERMNKINEAYDRIANPEKYAASDARRRGAAGGNTGSPYGNPYGGGYYDPFSGWQGSSGTGGAGSGQGGPSQNPYGWTTINIDDLFGGAYAQQKIHPEESATDSPEMRQAVYAINADNFTNAINILQRIPSRGRTARWYYLFALANNGAGNTVAAHDNIRRACQMDPSNADYKRAQQAFTQTARTYTQQGEGRGFTTVGLDPSWLCCCLCLGPTVCGPFARMCMYGGFF